MNERYSHADRGRRHAPAGSRMRPHYHRVREPGKAPYLEQIGETDQQAVIQSYAEETDVNRIVQRYQAGDVGIVQRVQGVYTDISGLPTDLTTAFETVHAARAYYEGLPAEVQRSFPSLGAFLDGIRLIPPDQPKEKEKEVKHDE